VVAVNRTGFEPDPTGETEDDGILFWGSAFVAAPGRPVPRPAPGGRRGRRGRPLRPRPDHELRHGWPFFRDRRIDAYGARLVERFIER
jgi:N-carbamoylputrescine amidase